MSSSGVPGMLSWLSRVLHVPTSAHEALAMAVHGLLVTHGFRPAEVAAEAAEAERRSPRLPGEWGTAGYGGRYRHARSAMTFDVRAVAVGPRLVVHATAVEDDDVLHTLELRVDTYIRDGTDFAAAAGGNGERPAERTSQDAAENTTENTAESTADSGEPTEEGGTAAESTTGGNSANCAQEDASAARQERQPSNGEPGWASVFQRAEDLATLVQVNVAHRLVPDAAKDGYEAAADAGTAGATSSAAQSSRAASGSASAGVPARPPPAVPDDDPLRIGPPRRPGIPAGGGYGGIGGLGGMGGMGGMGGGFGADDLVAPGLPGNIGGRPGPGFGGGMGGNLMGPRHPGFGGGIGGGIGGGSLGPFGGGHGGLPPGVPPGARFDPYGPPDPTANYGPRGTGPLRPGRPAPGGRGSGPGSGVPDNDIELPAPDDDERQVGPGAPPPDMYW